MSAQNPSGGQKFWFNGLPVPGLKSEANDTGTLKFWFNGLPVPTLFPPTLTLTPALVADADTVYSPATGIDQSTIAPDLHVDADAFYSPTAAGSAATLDPSPFNDADTIYQSAVSAGDITISPSSLIDTEIYFLHHIVSTATLAASLYDDSDTFYSVVVTPETSVSLFVDDDVFHVPIVTPGEVGVDASLFVDDDTLYEPSITAVSLLLPALVTNDDAVYTAVITSPVTLRPSLVSDAGTIYAATAVSRNAIVPPFVINDVIIYTPVDASIYNVFSELFEDIEIFYEPSVSTSGIGLVPDVYTDIDVFYTPTVQRQSVHGNPGGGTGGTVTTDLKYATKVTMDASGLITALQMVASSAKMANTRMMIYGNSAGVPGALLGQTASLSSIVSGTNSYPMTVPVSVLVGQVIWVALHTDGNVNWLLNNSPGGSRYNADLFSDGPSDPFGTSSVDNKKAPVLIVLLDAVNAAMTPALYDDAATFYSPVITKTYSVIASDLQDEDFFYSASVVSTFYVSPDTLAPDDVFDVPTLSPGEVVLHPPFIETDDAAIIPVIGVGDGNVFPPRLESDDTFGEETSVTLEGGEELPNIVIDDDLFLVPDVVCVYPLTPDSVTDDTVFYDADVAPGPVTLLPSLVTIPDEHWISDLIRGVGDVTLLPEMVEDGDVFYSPGYGAPRHVHRVALRGDANRPQMNVSADNAQTVTGDATTDTALRGRNDSTGIILDGDASAVNVELEGNDA